MSTVAVVSLPSDIWGSICGFLTIKRVLLLANTTSKSFSKDILSANNQGFWETVFHNSAREEMIEYIREKVYADSKVVVEARNARPATASQRPLKKILLIRAGNKGDFTRVCWRNACALVLRGSFQSWHLWTYIKGAALKNIECEYPPVQQATISTKSPCQQQQHNQVHLLMDRPTLSSNSSSSYSLPNARVKFAVNQTSFDALGDWGFVATHYFKKLANEIVLDFRGEDAASSAPTGKDVTLFCSNVGRIIYYSTDYKNSFLDNESLLGNLFETLFMEHDFVKAQVKLSMCQIEEGGSQYWDIVARGDDMPCGYSGDLKPLAGAVNSANGEIAMLEEQPITSYDDLLHYFRKGIEKRSLLWGDYNPFHHSLMVNLKVQQTAAGGVAASGAEGDREGRWKTVKIFLLGRMVPIPKSASTYDRSRATKLNAALNNFKNCVTALADPKQQQMIPWRNFPLGKVLGPMFSGADIFTGERKMYVITGCDGIDPNRDFEALKIQEQLRMANLNL